MRLTCNVFKIKKKKFLKENGKTLYIWGFFFCFALFIYFLLLLIYEAIFLLNFV